MKWTYNVHIYIYIYIYIYNIEQRNLETRKTRNDFPVQLRNFLLPFILKVFRHKEREREAQSFNSGFFICPLLHFVRHLPKASASKRKSTLLVRCLVSTLLTYIEFPKSSARFRCVTSFALASPVSHLGLLWHLWVTHPLRPRTYVWTPALMLHPSNPCTEPKSSQPH